MNAKCNGVKALMTSRPNLNILGLIIPLTIHLGRRMNAKCNGVKALMTSRPNLSILELKKGSGSLKFVLWLEDGLG